MPEYSMPDGQHKGNYTHNPDVRQTVQSLPANKILNTYTTRRDYMADLRKQKSPWQHWQKTFGNYLGNFKANLTNMATKMQKSFDDNNRVSRPNYQPQDVFMPHGVPKRSEQATKTTTQIKNRQHIRMPGEGLGNGRDKQLRENLNGAANNVKNFFNSIGKGTRHFGNSVMDALELRDLQKPMRETIAKGHQVAKRVRNYLKNPDKEKQREQNKEPEPEFSQGFSNFIHHPREAVQQAAHQAKYGFTALQDRIARFNRENKAKGLNPANALMSMLTAKRLARLKQKQAQLEKRQAQFKRRTLELGVPNKQGMSLERDQNGNFYFLANKDTHIPTGPNTPDQVFKKGDRTGLIVPQGRKSLQTLAEYSHGDRDLTLGFDPKSTIILGKNLENPNIFGPDSNLHIKNSVVELDGQGKLDGTTIDNSHVKATAPIKNTLMTDSTLNTSGPMNNDVLQDVVNGYNSGKIDDCQFSNSTLTNASTLKGSRFMNTSLQQGRNHVINYADVQNAQISNVNALGDERHHRETKLYNGNFADSDIQNSQLNLGNLSHLNDSAVADSRIVSQDLNSGQFSIDHAALDNSTLSVDRGQTQNIKDTALGTVLVTGRQDLDRVDLNAESNNPAFLHNTNIKRFKMLPHNMALNLHDVRFDGRNRELMPNQLAPQYDSKQGAAYTLLKHITGLANDNALHDVHTRNGIMTPTDQINTVSRNLADNSEPNSPQKVIDFETLQTPENGVNLEGRVDTSTPVKSGDVSTPVKSGDVALTVPHANVPRLNKRGPVVETHVSADPVANYEELAHQDAQRDYLAQQAQEAEPEEPQMETPEPQEEDVSPEPEQSKLDERNDRKIEAHKMRQQAKKHTTPVNNTPNEPNANMDSLEANIPPETNNMPPEPDPEPDF